jgi:hypothetical protein
MESAKKRPVPQKKAKFITPEKTGELRSTVHFRIRVPVPVWYGGTTILKKIEYGYSGDIYFINFFLYIIIHIFFIY